MMEEHKTKRRGKGVVVALGVALGVFGLFKWLTVATPVSEDDAVALFEDENRAEGPHKIATELKADPTSKNAVRKGRKPREGRSSASTRGKGPSSSSSLSNDRPESLVLSEPVVPEEGVYTYETHGGEKFSGAQFRSFPTPTYRSVIHTSSRSWTEHHTFIEERQTWTSYRSDSAALLCDWARQYVAFGGGAASIKIDKTVNFDQPVRILWLPWELGRRWGGSFHDATGENIYGTYTVSTGTHEYIDVGGESIEAWMEVVALEIHGDYEGTIEVKRWTSPAYGVAVREESVADVSQGPLRYTAEFWVQLASLQPAR